MSLDHQEPITPLNISNEGVQDQSPVQDPVEHLGTTTPTVQGPTPEQLVSLESASPMDEQERKKFSERLSTRLGAAVTVAALGAGVALGVTELGSKQSRGGERPAGATSTATANANPSQSMPTTTSPAKNTSPSPTDIPTATAGTTANQEKSQSFEENMGTPPAEVATIAEQYGLKLKEVPYSAYPEGTQKYAAAKGLPNHYYDLTTLTKPLTIEDYKTLVPVLLTNLFLVQNTNDIHYLDMGNGTQFGDNIAKTPPAYLIAPDSGKDRWGDSTPYGTFNFSSANVNVYEAPYNGPLTQYSGRTVIHIDLTNIHVRDESTQGLDGGYIDTIGEKTGSFPELSNSSPNGPFTYQYLQFDPATNNIIAQTFQNKY